VWAWGDSGDGRRLRLESRRMRELWYVDEDEMRRFSRLDMNDSWCEDSDVFLGGFGIGRYAYHLLRF